MKVTAVYFSPTGNTKKSTEAMAAALSNDYKSLDLTIPANGKAERQFEADDFVIFGMPVYAGRIPMAAAPRLAGLKGNGTPCIIVATYGNRHYDDALVEMEDIAKANGFVVKGAAALIGRHTYGEIQVDRPNKEDLEASAKFAKNVAEKTAAEKDGTAEGCGMSVIIPGNRPYLEGIPGGSHKPLTFETCVGCGLCKEGCPVGAKNMDTEAYNTFAAAFTEKLAVRRENEFFF